MLECILADGGIIAALIKRPPQQLRSLIITAVLQGARRQDLQKRVRTGDHGSLLKSFARRGVVLQLNVVNEAQILIKPPFPGILPNAALQQPDRGARVSRPLRRVLRQKNRSEIVGWDQPRIQRRGNVKQGIEQLVLHRISRVPGAEVLHHPGPVNVSQQRVVPQAQAVEYGGRRDVKNFFQRRVGTHPV